MNTFLVVVLSGFVGFAIGFAAASASLNGIVEAGEKCRAMLPIIERQMAQREQCYETLLRMNGYGPLR